MTAFCGLTFAANITVGYCDGQIASSSNYSVVGKGKVSCAVRISPDVLARYVGNEIRGVNAGLVSVKYCDSIVSVIPTASVITMLPCRWWDNP